MELRKWRIRFGVAVLLALWSSLLIAAHAQSPEPPGWYSGDMHVHRSCGDAPRSVSSIYDLMVAEDLAVVSLLADMGNGEVQNPATDLPKVNGQDDPVSTPGRIVHWDAEWHWDATYLQFPHQALGGHLVSLGLTNAYQIWDESTCSILNWARHQGAVSGFAHMQFLGDTFPQTLSCCTPIEYPVEVALGASDFISEDIAGSDTATRAYYRLLNCGFRPGLAGGSDYPCGANLGDVVTYVQVPGELTYRKWIDGLAAGRTVVSRNRNNEFLDLKMNTTNSPGDEIQLPGSGNVSVTVQWSANQNLSGTIELVRNGVVVASRSASVTASTPHTWTTNISFANSGWLCARRIGSGGHQSHTAAVFVLVNGAPIRASAEDANFFVNWMDELLTRTAAGGVWGSYFTTNRAMAHARYRAAKGVYQQIALEAGAQPAPPVTLGNGNEGITTDYLWSNGPWINTCRYQASNNTTVTTIYAKVGAIAGKYKCAIYNDVNGQPDRLLRGTQEVSGPEDGWNAFPLTSSLQLTNGSFYWLAIWSDDANAVAYYSDTIGVTRWNPYTYGNWPDPISTSGPGNFNYCIFAASSSVVLTNITFTPSDPTVTIESAQQLTATGHYTDGSTQDVTSQATWVASSPLVAAVSASGLVTAVAAGSTVVFAALPGAAGSTSVSVTEGQQSLGDYRSIASGNWNQTSTWQQFNGSSWVSAATTPTAANANVIRVRSPHTVTVSANVSADQIVVETGGQVTVTNVTWTIPDGAGTDLTVYGTLRLAGSSGVITPVGTISFESGSTYQHARLSGAIPTASWNTNSTCALILTSPAAGSWGIAGTAQTFGHFSIATTGTGTTGWEIGSNISCAGNFTLNNGSSRPAILANSGTGRTLSIGGNFTITVGTLDLSSSSGAGTIQVAGDFVHAAGTITETGTGSGNVVFNGTAPQSYTGGGTMANTINLTVNGSATLMMGTALVGNGSGGIFTLASGGTLGIGHVQGITTSGDSGNVRVAGVRSYSTGGSYIYNGVPTQVTGNGLPATVNNLVIANPAGVAVNGTHAVSGLCTVNAGAVLLGTGTINGPTLFNGVVSPGGSVGQFSTGAQTWPGGGSYTWEMNNATGAAGSGYDQLNASGNGITISATSGNKFTLKLVTLNGASPGQAANFNSSSGYNWTIASAGSVSGFAADRVAIDVSGFQNNIGVGTFSIEQSGGNLVLKFANQLVITTTNLPSGLKDVVYSTTLSANGGPPPYTWSIAAGSLPSGLTLSASGSISGTPTVAGNYDFTVQVSDSSVPVQHVAKPLTIAITAPPSILVLTNSANPFTAYYSEILLAEGLNSFALRDISSLSAATLAPHDVVVLGNLTLTTTQVTTLSNWVNQGGNLIAMRPDKKLAALLGLIDASSTLSEGYLLVNTSNGPGAGIVGETIQFHGTADRYTLGSATSLATLYSNASTATANPAVTLRSVGGNGGQAAAFTFDLARSVVYTRQGNPAWDGQERDGFTPIRSDDLFFGNASFDPQPDWVDFNKIAIPQADEQQRLLANMIIQMNADRRLLPRFWYFPNQHKAVVVMTGDDHANNGTAGRFDQYLAYSNPGGSVEDWETIRGSSYVYHNTPISDAAAAAYHAQGFEIALHLNTQVADYDSASLNQFFTTQLAAFAAAYPSLPPPETLRVHAIVWSRYSLLPEVARQYGIRLSTDYYYWPPGWVQDRPGLFTGSGMVMRHATTNGNLIDVYQAATQMTDESAQSYPFTCDALLNRALGPEGYYGFFVANMHTDFNTPTDPGKVGSDAIVTSAINRGVPVITARQLLTWLDSRNNSSIRSISSSLNAETFSVVADPAARGLQVMVPVRQGYSVTSATHNGSAVSYSFKSIKGIQYAILPAQTGVYQINYELDTTPPTIVAREPAPDALGVSLSVTVKAIFSEPMAPSTINSGTITLKDSGNNPVPATVSYSEDTLTATLVPAAELARGQTYTITVKGGVAGVTDFVGLPLVADSSWSFTTTESYTIWNDSVLPAILSEDDSDAVELGVKFRSAVAGYVTGIRFYKSPSNTGTHVGNLWTSTGTLLGSTTFLNETASGWQYQALLNPVQIAADTTYIVSYHAPVGRYSKTEQYFIGAGVTNYPLRALADGEHGPNGVYEYGTTSEFPTVSHVGSHYWVDIEFTENPGPDISPPVIVAVNPASGGSASGIGSSVKAAFNEPIKVSTINSTTFTLRDSLNNPVPATVWYNAANFTATLVPDDLLTLSETYTATVKGGAAGVTDLATNHLAGDFIWSFSVAPIATGTVGNTNDGSLIDGLWFGGAWINACRYGANNNWTVTDIIAKVTAIAGKYKCAIFADNGGQPAQLLRGTTEISNPSAGWQNFPLTSSLTLTSGQFYWLAIWSDDPNAGAYYSGNNGTIQWGQHAYGNWPDPLTTTGSGNLNYSIYASGFLAPTLASIAVTPANPTIENGNTQQFTATATYTDGSTQNVTSQATWISSNAVVATVNANGLASGLSSGTTTIAASWGGLPGFATLAVVGQSSATVTLNNLNQAYDGTARVVTANTTPSELAVSITYNGTATAPTNAGNYQVIGTVTEPNYTGAATNTLTVGQRALTVTADAKSKVYGTTDPALTYQITSGSLVGTDSLTGELSRAAGENIGLYPIGQGTLSAGGNYDLAFVGANFEIIEVPRLLSIAELPNGHITTTWQVHPDRDYAFCWKENLTNTIWTTSFVFTSTAAVVELPDETVTITNRHRFYRLVDVTP